MNVFYRNFWSLHADFVHDFSTLRHKGFSLPLLITFHRFTHHPDFQPLLQDPSFAAKYTRSRIVKNRDLQPYFDLYIKRRVPLKKRKNGKIVLFVPLLRFPYSIQNNYLTAEETIVVSPGMRDSKDGPNVWRMGAFFNEKNPAWKAVAAKARRLLDRHGDHPIFGHPFFRESFLEVLKLAFGAAEGVTKLFETHPIAATVLGATNEPVGRALAIMSSRRRIPSIATQHGLIGNEQGFLPVFAAKLAVHGKDEQQFYANRGVNPKDVHVTGHPRMDVFRTAYPGDRKTLHARYRIPEGNKVVLAATNQIRDMAVWSTYLSLLAGYPKVTILIKPHRNEVVKGKLADYVKLAQKYPNIKVLADKSDVLKNILPHVDAAVTELSTSGLEAMVCGVPTLFLRKPSYDNINHRYYYEKMNEFVSTDPAYLAKLTHAVLKQNSVREKNLAGVKQFLSHAYPVDLSAEALTRLLGRLTGKIIRRKVARKYEGMLVKGTKPEIYYVRGQLKRHIVSPKVMAARKFNPDHVRLIPDDDLKQIPPGHYIS